MTRNVAGFLTLFAALAAGQAVHWFIGGEYLNHSQTRNILVVAQLVVGVVATIWLGLKSRRPAP